MDAFELMGKVSRKGGVWVGAERGDGGGDPVVQSACVGVACVPWRAWGLRACRGREPRERLLRDTAASEHGWRS